MTDEQKRKRYSGEFKLSAVKRMDEVKSIAELARELKVARKFLYLWRSQFKKGGAAVLGRGPGRPPGTVIAKKQAPVASAAELVSVLVSFLLKREGLPY